MDDTVRVNVALPILPLLDMVPGIQVHAPLLTGLAQSNAADTTTTVVLHQYFFL